MRLGCGTQPSSTSNVFPIVSSSHSVTMNHSTALPLHLKSIQKPSVPPRLSAIETSASGSTKELHFHCTFSSPEVVVEVVLTQPKAVAEDDSPSTESFLVQMQQISCRVQIVCAALEGDYVLLSWKMVSPLLVQRLSLLTMDREPVSTI
ncbi:hypothetical protein CSKR_202134 [Clonorchis sinensis]|uniref:Uncharacterized protein n=1 Tax=Clonorchis sinensis TaxID=79923 RepID=A0A8T1LXB9_CLOSI|nr:hypothetical protein CSKR_202134 [Clonorchis sinensis]